jgi:HEAT repeat protein
VGMVVWTVWGVLKSDPVYRGKSASQWLRQLDQSPFSTMDEREALDALRAMGDPATRYLVAKALEPKWKRYWSAWCAFPRTGRMAPDHPAAQAHVALHRIDPQEREGLDMLIGSLHSTNAMMAFALLRDLRPAAAAATEDLLQIVAGTNSLVMSEALDTLKLISPASLTNAIPLLLPKLGDPEPDRLNAAAWLLRINPADPRGLAVMIRCLESSQFSSFVIDDLAQIGTNAAPAIPLLEARLKDPNKSTRIAAAEALSRIRTPSDGAR